MPSFLDKLRLDGRLIMLTGASGYLGQAFSPILAELGADLILVDHDSPKLRKLAEELKANYGVTVHKLPTNLENCKEREQLINDCRGLGNLDCLINNAAFVGSSNLTGWAVPFGEQSLDSWQSAIEVNLTAAFHLCQGLSPLLTSSKYGGSIINIGSIYAEYGPKWDLYSGTQMGNPAAYGTSKAALLQLTKWLASTLAPSVRVNAISPGGIERGQPEVFITRYTDNTLLNRMATEDDVCGALVFLISDMSLYVTGENIRVSGGWGVC